MQSSAVLRVPDRPRVPRPLLWPLLFGLSCIACDETPAAPVEPAAPAPEPPPPETPPPPEVEHVVEEGETLWDIARAYGVKVDDILEANGLRPRDVRRLRKGSKLRIVGASEKREVETAADRADQKEDLPPLEDGAYHFVASGESLWTLSRTYDVPMETLMERNGFDDDAVGKLRVGQPVIIPGIKPGDVKKAAPQAQSGIVHELAPGETVWDIAYAFQVGVGEIMAANGLSAEKVTRLRDGTRLFIPGVEDRGGGRIRRKVSARESRAAAVARRLGLGSRQTASKLLSGHVEPRWMRAAGGNTLPGTLRWPVSHGWFVRGFGSGEGGYHLAMDIMGKIGWNVRAAAPGIVGYSGNEVRGYGNIVLVVHPGGWVTMYAHNSVNFVAAGEKVPRGGILAEVGSTGISRGPHVHFELMQGGKNCDPAPLFRPGVRHRSGKLSDIEAVTWRSAKSRPKQIHCFPRRRHPRSRWVIHEDPGSGEDDGAEP